MKKTFLTIISAVTLTFIPFTATTTSAQKTDKVLKGVGNVLNSITGILGGSKNNSTTKTQTQTSETENPSTTTVTETRPDGKTMKIQSVHPDLKVRVKRCVAAQKKVLITVEITNVSEQDDHLQFNNWRYSAVDDGGNEYSGSQIQIYTQGNQANQFDLVSDVKKTVEIRINNVPTSVENIARLMLPIDRSSIFPTGNIILRNIPIDRDEE